MAFTQQNRHVTIETTLGNDALLLESCSGTERLNEAFQFQVNLLGAKAGIDCEKLVGTKALLTLSVANERKRYFHGYFSSFSFTSIKGSHSQFSATLVPWLWMLKQTTNCRIFQNKSVPEILTQLFRDRSFSDFEMQLGNCPRIDYCVQYNESDYDFVNRLVESEGIHYYFRHEKGRHILVLSDSNQNASSFPGYEQVLWHTDNGVQEEEYIHELQTVRSLRPGCYATDDYNFEKPKANIGATIRQPATHPHGSYECFQFPGIYRDSDEGRSKSEKRLNELQSDSILIHARGNARGISCGSTFGFKESPDWVKNLTSKFFVTGVTHHITSNAFETGRNAGTSAYQCSFTSIPAKSDFRPARSTPKPVIMGPQTARVTGPKGEEIFTDKYGRVKVQFHWDRLGKYDDKSSCWVRVSNSCAGKNWGEISIPRVGQEVIVEFLNGDPDYPIITGRVYNAEQMPPYNLPGEKALSGLKTNSTKGGGGYNELVFDDAKGKEMIRFHAERDMETQIENDLTMNAKGEMELTADKKILIKVGESKIELTPAGLKLNGTLIQIN